MDLIRFDRTDHHPVTFAFVADRNFPDSDFHRAVCNDRQTSTSVFGRNAQIPVVPWSAPQNGNAYEEVLSDGWSPIRAYWQRHFARHRTRFAHPEVQLDMSDYKSNVALYPTFPEYFRTHTPPLLAALGAETSHSSCRRGPRCSSATSRTRLCALRYKTFRAGDACPRGRGGHSRLPSLNDNVNRNSPDAS